jgi:hypothetical protein
MTRPPRGGTRGGSGALVPGGGTLVVSGIEFHVPQGWVAETPSSAMRQFQYRLPRAEGDAHDGEVVFSTAGGDVKGNVERWEGFFEGRPSTEVTERQVGGLAITIATIRGAYTQGFRGATGVLPSFLQVTAIVPIPGSPSGQQIFVKALGPEATIARWMDSFDELIGALHKA